MWLLRSIGLRQTSNFLVSMVSQLFFLFVSHTNLVSLGDRNNIPWVCISHSVTKILNIWSPETILLSHWWLVLLWSLITLASFRIDSITLVIRRVLFIILEVVLYFIHLQDDLAMRNLVCLGVSWWDQHVIVKGFLFFRKIMVYLVFWQKPILHLQLIHGLLDIPSTLTVYFFE